MEIAKARENFSIGASYNITKNQDNPIKTVYFTYTMLKHLLKVNKSFHQNV